MQLGDKFKSRTPFTFIVVSSTGEKFKEHRDLEGRVIGKNTDNDPKKSFAMVKPPHAEEINYCIVSFSDYEKFNKFTNSTENMKEAKKSQPELDYKDKFVNVLRDLKVGQEYVWIMGAEPLLVKYTGMGKKKFTYNFEFVNGRGNHDLSGRDVRDYIKFKLDEGIKMKSNTQVKLRRLIERLIREESSQFKVGDKVHINGRITPHLYSGTIVRIQSNGDIVVGKMNPGPEGQPEIVVRPENIELSR